MKTEAFGFGYLDEFAENPDEIDDDRRAWWCASCGAVGNRHHSRRKIPFCPNCDGRDAVLIEMKPVGPGADKITD
jgi:Zn finger protein HypA/HybF involved in hydrogenase expression